LAVIDPVEIQRALDAHEEKRAILMDMLALAKRYHGLNGGESPAASHAGAAAPAPKKPISNGVAGQTVALALKMIEETGKPVTTRAVIEEMPRRGIRVPEKHATNIVSARLSNSDALEGRRGVGWWPTGRPWPAEDAQITLQDAGGADVGE
jgi:hypothetical protein